MRAAAARGRRPSALPEPGRGHPATPLWGIRRSCLPATRSAPPAARLRLREPRNWGGGVVRGAGRPRPRPHELPASGAAGPSSGRPGGGARGGSPDGTFVSARGTGGSAAPRPAGEPGEMPPVLHVRSATPLRSGGPVLVPPLTSRCRSGPKLTLAPESGRPGTPPS